MRRHFGEELIFRDKEAIEGGVSWKEHVLEEIDEDSALLVLIDKDWADARDARGQRRLEDDDDPLRLEIADGLKDGATILPVLLENAQMPGADELPTELRPLADLNALKLRDGDWHYDLDRICKTLEKAGFQPIASHKPSLSEDHDSSRPVAKKGIFGVVTGTIGAVLVVIAPMGLSAKDLDRSGRVGLAIIAVIGLVMGIISWRESRFQRTKRGWILGTSVAILGLIGFIAALDGLIAPDPDMPRPVPGPSASPALTKVPEFTSVPLLNGRAVIRYDPALWHVDPTVTTPSGQFQYQHKSGEVWLKVVAERIEIPLERLVELNLAQIRQLDPNAQVTREGYREVNGSGMAYREVEATPSGVPLIYYIHYHSGPSGSIQFVGWTGRSLLGEHRSTIEQFLNGFAELSSGTGASGRASAPLLKGAAVLHYSPATWQAEKSVATGPGELGYVHKSGEVWCKVIAERIQMPPPRMAQLGLDHIRRLDPGAQVTREGSHDINGVNMLFREVEANVNDLPLSYYIHYYSDASGSIQFLAWTYRSLLQEHRGTVEEFLHGFEVAGNKSR